MTEEYDSVYGAGNRTADTQTQLASVDAETVSSKRQRLG
jgi:hypothetical protein